MNNAWNFNASDPKDGHNICSESHNSQEGCLDHYRYYWLLLVLFGWGRRSDLSSFSTLSMLPFFDVSQVSKFSLRQFAVAAVSAFWGAPLQDSPDPYDPVDYVDSCWLKWRDLGRGQTINDVHKKPHVVAEIILTHVSFWFVYVMNMLRVRTCEPRCMPQLVWEPLGSAEEVRLSCTALSTMSPRFWCGNFAQHAKLFAILAIHHQKYANAVNAEICSVPRPLGSLVGHPVTWHWAGG